MNKWLKRSLKIAGIGLGALLLLTAAAALLVIFDKPLVKKILLGRIARGAGTSLSIGRFDYSLFPFRLTAEGLEYGREDAFQRMEVSLKRLEAQGDFWRLVRGRKPALDTVEAEGLVFRLVQKEVSEEPLDIEAVLAQASDALAWAGRISAAGADLTIILNSFQARLENLDISLAAGGAAGEFAYSIGRSGLDAGSEDGAFGLETGLSSSGTLRLASPFGVDAAFRFLSPRVAADGAVRQLDAVDLETAVRFDTGTKELRVSRLKVRVPGLLDLEGNVQGQVSNTVFLEAGASARVESLEDLASLLGPLLPPAFRAAAVRGRAGLTGKYGFHRTNRETSDDLAASLALEDVEFDLGLGGAAVQARASGRVDAAGPTKNLRLSADVRSSFGKAAAGAVSAGRSELRLVGTATREAVDVSRLTATLEDFAFDAAPGQRISFDKVVIAGKVRLDLLRKNAVLDALEARFPGVAPLLMKGDYGWGGSPAARLRVESRGLDLPALRGIASPFLPEILSGWDFGGTADLSVEARRTAAPADGWSFLASVSLARVRFNDPAFTIAGDGLAPVLKVEGVYGASGTFSFAGSLDLGRGESLWKAVYVSWDKHPLNAAVSGRYDARSGSFEDLAARFVFPTIGEVGFEGTLRTRPLTSFDLASDARLRLGPLYSLYTQAGVTQENRLSVEGTLGAGLRIRAAGDALSVTGRLTLDGASLEDPASKALLLGVAAEIPVRYETGADAAVPSEEGALPEEGSLRIGEFQSAFLTLKSVALALRVGANAFAVEPLVLDLFGGRLELGRTTFRFDPRDGTLRGTGSLALRELDISRFPIRSPGFKLTGRIRAEFPSLDISSERIAVSGRGEADIFGGKVVLRDFAVSRPFAANRSISLNVDLVELDLKKLTDEVPFGEVTGIVSGEIRNLVLSYGQPERFEFRLESVPRKGVEQTFSLKAVDNLTVLSSGQQASSGAGGFWMSLVRGFRYQKLGIVSTLRNDTFTLNGTIHDGNVEYLVKKPALFGISVINREPDKVISFKEMTNRLKRVGQSGK